MQAGTNNPLPRCAGEGGPLGPGEGCLRHQVVRHFLERGDVFLGVFL
jgi:hypothetical protein